VSNEWFWVPEATSTYPTYSPALVAFIPFNNSSVAWVALGPGDPYATRYYDPYWQPTYVYPSNVMLDRVVNISIPGAVNVVPVQEFTQVIDPRIITHVDPQTITRVRPVLDPLTVKEWRKAAFETRAARGRIDIPRQVEQRLNNTTVIASNTPASAFKRDLARALKVEPVAEKAKKQRLQISDQRGVVTPASAPQTTVATEQQRERQMLELARQASRGDRNARQQMQELRRQQVEQRSNGRLNVPAGARVGQPVPAQDQRQVLRQQQQAQRDAARQQMITTQQQRQQQVQAQREQRKQTQIQRAPARSAPQPQVLRPQPQQRKEQRPPQSQRSAQPRMIAPAEPQVRAQPNRGQEKRAAPAAAPQQQQVRPQPAPQAQKQPKAAGPPSAPGGKGGGKKKP
jgi:hypothetical protein